MWGNEHNGSHVLFSSLLSCAACYDSYMCVYCCCDAHQHRAAGQRLLEQHNSTTTGTFTSLLISVQCVWNKTKENIPNKEYVISLIL